MRRQLFVHDIPIKQFFALAHSETTNIFWEDLNGIYLGCNDTMAALTKMTPEQVVGLDDRDLNEPEYVELLQRNNNEVINSGVTGVYQESSKPLGTDRLLHYMSIKAPMTDAAGHLVGIFGLAFPLGVPSLAGVADYIKGLHNLSNPVMPKGVVSGMAVQHGSWQLSQREHQIAYLLVRGMSAKEIAARLNISSRTVEFHIDSMKKKLNCNKRSQLISTLLDSGLLI